MLSEDLRACLRPVLIVQKILWFALTVPIPIYLAVLLLRDRAPAPEIPGAPPWLRAAFTAAALVAGAFSVFYSRRAFSDERLLERLRGAPALPVPPAGAAGDAPPALADKLRAYAALQPADRRLLALAASLTVPGILCLAANEAVASFGFALGLVGGETAAALPFGAAALYLNLRVYPRTEAILLRLQGWADVA